MGLPPWAGSDEQLFVLVTGTNGGLGFSIGTRLIDEFLLSPARNPRSHLVFIASTRTSSKTQATISRLQKHINHTTHSSQEQAKRIHLCGVELDLCHIRQVYNVAEQLKSGSIRYGQGEVTVKVPRLDVLVLNAGIGGWTGVNWPLAIREFLTAPVQAASWPTYKLAEIGTLVDDKSRVLLNGSSEKVDGNVAKETETPVLGQVFAANLFGHYVLAHELMPLLRSAEGRDESHPVGRLIWLSSVESEAAPFKVDLDDFQGLKSHIPYEVSKRITDLMVLTAELPGVSKVSESFFALDGKGGAGEREDEEEADRELPKPQLHLVHPGICGTDIFPLPAILAYGMLLAFYVARWLGSPWHTVNPYNGACAPVWLALTEQDVLDRMEERGHQKGKWGSSTSFWGDTRVRRTYLSGWGWNGIVGERQHGVGETRKKGSLDATAEMREEFEVQGRKVWSELERMRRQWEALVKRR